MTIDGAPEKPRSFDRGDGLSLTNAVGAFFADATGSAIIMDAGPTVSINSTAVMEGDSGVTDAVFALTLSAPSPVPVIVDYKTADKSAVAGSDYVATTGTVTFAPGVTAQTITVKV